MTALALLPLLAQDEPASATVHAALVESLAERPQVRDLCCVCADPGEHRGGHVLWPEGPVLCDSHYHQIGFVERSEGVDFERAVSLVCVAEDERVAAECAGAA